MEVDEGDDRWIPDIQKLNYGGGEGDDRWIPDIQKLNYGGGRRR